MANRKHAFAAGEHYHCFNRGVEKRDVFCDQDDYEYFIKSLLAYNTTEVFGELRLHKNKPKVDPPVTILSYCLLPNHYHLLLQSNVDGGVSKFIQRLSGGYTMYFNKKYKRSGSLFQGAFKSKHISTDQDLRQVLAYVYHNHKVHNLRNRSLFRNYINTSDTLVGGLTSNYSDKQQLEAINIIKELRAGFD